MEEAQQAQLDAAAAQDSEPQCTYNAERVIGNGTFGIVYSAHIVETDETVAIKKVFVDRRYRNRELQLWKEMRHPNIVTLKHAFYTSGDSPDELYLNMVMEYVPETVYCVMKRFGKQKQHMPKVLVQLYTYQASRALAHLHASNIVHRDIKPQNLLVDATRGHLLKLCDFGSAARLGNNRPALVAYICSRYYRAPELIFGATGYTTSVDLWSIGCVLAEMLRGKPLFPGENGVDQLVEIVKVLGSPNRRQVLAMNQQYFNFNGPTINGRSWDTVFSKNVGQDARSLLEAFLQYDPEQRVRPLEACAHHFFDDLRDERKRCPDGQPLPSELFNLTSRELRVSNKNVQERLVPVWHSNRSPTNSHGTAAAQQASQMANGGEELG
jgi:glycogen synthase kinase 3 beta